MNKENRGLLELIRIFYGVLVIFIVFFSCERNSGFDATGFKELLSEQIKTKINNKNRIEIRIKDLTDFEWDAFFIIPPYAKISALENELKLDLGMMRNIRIEERDDMTILVFVNQGKVTRFVEYPRWPGDFSELGEMGLYSPRDARFEVEEVNELTSTGRKWLLIKK